MEYDREAITSASADTSTYTDLGTLTVDGETFTVHRRDGEGSHHYGWISGPNVGYGFSVFGGAEPITHEQHLIEIRGFLASIDPATGYV